MDKKIAMLLTSAAIVSSAYCAAASDMPAEADSVKTKIMAVGDSITDGYWTQGGYRKYLSYTLSQMGYSDIDFVGPKGSDTESFTYNGQTVSYDGNYAGYSGYAIQHMTGTEERQGILETLQDGDFIRNYDPDIVLLQIGTNDILSAYNDGITDRLENLINYILSEGNGNVLVFVTTIPDIDAIEVSSWLWAYGEEKWNNTEEDFAKIVQGHVDSYNASIAGLVTKMQGEGKNVMFGDIHSVVDVTSDLYDGVHPNETGYEKMGQYWAEVLDNYFKGGDVTSTEPTEDVSAETTTSAPDPGYDYNVSDVIKLANYLLNRADSGITADNCGIYDIDGSGRLDVFDLVQLRRKLFE